MKDFFYITQYFTPEPYLKDIEFIKSLKNKGWDPVVITGFPNYPKGELYTGYKNSFISVEDMDGIKVVRTFTYSDHSLNIFKRIMNYLCFGIFASYAVLKFGKKNSFFYILQSSPFVILIAWTIRLFKSKSSILLDIQDVFPENIRVSGLIKNKIIINSLDFILNKFYYSIFDYFVTVSNSFKKIVNSKGVEEKNILTLYNWSLVENNQSFSNNFKFEGENFNIVYAGNIGIHQGLSLLCEVYKRLQASHPNIKFQFFGDGTDYEVLKNKLLELDLNNVILHGRVSSTEIGKYLNAADCLFLHLVADPIYSFIIPSKLQAYIEYGKPILGGVVGEASDLIVNNELGEVFHSENVNEMYESILKIYNYTHNEEEYISKKSISLYKTEFSRESGLIKLNKFLRKNLNDDTN
ncbi:putative glycosyl transferase [compost metagenome]